MTAMIIFIATMCCVILQFLSRNLFFILMAGAGMLNTFALIKYYETENKIWSIPAIVINICMFAVAVMLHFNFGEFVNDYWLSALIMALFSLLTLIEISPFENKQKNKKADE